jgi:hypothetical protein
MEPEGAADERVLNKVHKKSPFIICCHILLAFSLGEMANVLSVCLVCEVTILSFFSAED